MDNTKAGGAKKKFKGVACTLDAIQDMLNRLPESARTVCTTAAFTRFSASELRGLRWTDYKGRYLAVGKRWRQHVGQPKMKSREGAVGGNSCAADNPRRLAQEVFAEKIGFYFSW